MRLSLIDQVSLVWLLFSLLLCSIRATSTHQSSMSFEEEQSDVRYVADSIYFQASSVQAIFRDGEHIEYESESIHYNSTVIGDYLSFTDANGNKKREARLYFIPPQLDWKQNQTYHWKLNQAWISDDYFGWLFWNVNGFIDSQLQRSSDSEVFQCEYVELDFWSNSPKGRFQTYQGKLIMKNVQLAAFLPTAYKEASLIRFNPCGEDMCRAINGNITCKSDRQWKIGAVFVSFVVAVVIVAIYKRTNVNVSTYSRVSSTVDPTELDDISFTHDDDD